MAKGATRLVRLPVRVRLMLLPLVRRLAPFHHINEADDFSLQIAGLATMMEPDGSAALLARNWWFESISLQR
jgi:hypothetical protein